jgi:hypothetical protein
MSEEMRTISLQNLSDVIRLVTESSRGTAVDLNVDLFGFMALARYWNFSYDNSLICYVDNQPASIVLNCADYPSHEAYTFFWGTVPRFRQGRTAMRVFEAACQKLRDNGFRILNGISSPDRPARRYRFIQAAASFEMLDLLAKDISLPPADSGFEVRAFTVDALPEIVPQGVPFPWSQRKPFLQHIAPFIQVLGAFSGDELKAYAIALRHSASTVLLDIRSTDFCAPAVHELLRYLSSQDFLAPFIVENVFQNSPMLELLAAAGFGVKRQFCWLSRDLTATTAASLVNA